MTERELILGTIADLEALLGRRQEELQALEAELLRHHTELRGLDERLTHWRKRLSEIDVEALIVPEPALRHRTLRDQALELLAKGSMTLAALAREMGVPNSTLRYHITALRNEGKVRFDGEVFMLGEEPPEKAQPVSGFDTARILDLLREVPGGLSLKEIADTLKLDRDQTSATLAFLQDQNQVQFDERKWTIDAPPGLQLPPPAVTGPETKAANPETKSAGGETQAPDRETEAADLETPLDVEAPIRERNGDARQDALRYLRNCREASSEQIAVALGAGTGGTVEAVALMRQLQKEGLVKRNEKHASWSVTEEGKRDG